MEAPPPPETFADLLAKALADLPVPPPSSPPPKPPSRRSLMHKILARKAARGPLSPEVPLPPAAPEALPAALSGEGEPFPGDPPPGLLERFFSRHADHDDASPAIRVVLGETAAAAPDDDADGLFLDVAEPLAVAPEAPPELILASPFADSAAPDEDEDVLVLDQEVAVPPIPPMELLLADDAPAPAASEEAEDDVLVLDEAAEVIPDDASAVPDEDQDVLVLDQEVAVPPVDLVLGDEAPVPALPEEAEDDVLVLDEAAEVIPDDASAAPDEDQDVLVLDQEVAVPPLPPVDLALGDEAPVPAVSEEAEDDVLVLDEAAEVIPVAASAAPDEDQDILLLDQEVAVPPVDLVLADEAPVPALPEEAEDDVLVLDEAAEVIPDDASAAPDEDQDILLLDQEVDDPPIAVEPPPEEAPDDDVLVLDERFLPEDGACDRDLSRQAPDIPPPAEDGPPPGPSDREVLEGVLVTLLLRDASVPPAPVSPEPDPAPAADPVADPMPVVEPETDADELVLDDSYLAGPPPPSPEMNAEEMVALIAAATPEGAGSLDLPERLDALALLLLTPADDFIAQDLLRVCWPRSSGSVGSRALLAVAINLGRNFGLPGKLPMAAAKAWRMLDPRIFQSALVDRLAAVGDYVAAWQRSQANFLSLDYGEIELIEYLFESIHPGYNIQLLASVMDYKVLSGRRLGLLRRIPVQARKMLEEAGAAHRQQAVIQLAHYKALLERIAESSGYHPIVAEARHALEELDKVMKQAVTPPAAPDGARSSGLAPLPLGKI